MTQRKVTIYETIDRYGFKTYWCSTRRHYWWKDAQSATKCCNGWTPVYRPTYYCSGAADDWGRWYEPVSPWAQILVPEFLTDEIAKLKAIHLSVYSKGVLSWNWEQSSPETQ